VGGRDCAALGLALRDRGLRLAARQPPPAVLLVHELLLEPERARPELPRSPEVADPVPDDRVQSIRPGSSRKSFTLLRKSAAVAPSSARWSQVSVSDMSGATSSTPSRTTGCSVIAPTAR